MEKNTLVRIASLDLALVRKQAAQRITRRNTFYSAGVSLLPFPMIDAAVLLALQLHMLRSIARLYQVDFQENLAKSLVGSLAGFVGTAGLIKVIPSLGALLGGATTAAVAAAGTYATGVVFTHHFAQGGTLLDFDPIKSRAFFQKEFEAGRKLVAADINEVEEEDRKGKKGFFGGLFFSQKQQQEWGEMQELRRIQGELRAAVAELKGMI
ncbi:MAG: DUF697 domain-containing protein [Phaeodactylibacter sp.]|nr:DUF697 domain-containing protein [Phaeodactylibacter sp.]